jgi:long-chain fatty acid transport protein
MSLRSGRIRLCVFLTIAVCVAPAWSRADVLSAYGFSPRGIGMGGAMTAVADDFATAYYNPAGAAFHPQASVGLGYLFTDSALHGIGVKTPELEQSQDVLFGAVLPIPFGGFLKDRIAFSAALQLPNSVLLGIDVPYPTDPQFLLLQESGRGVSMFPTFAVKILPALSLGGGVQIFDNTTGDWQGRIDPDGSIQATVTQELTASYSPIAGLMFRPGAFWPSVDGLQFGFVFRDRFFTRYQVPVATYIGSVPLRADFEAISLYTPREYIAGASYAFGRWLVALDGAYNAWSDFPDPNLDMKIHLRVPFLPITLHDSRGLQPSFHDTITVRTGAQAKAWESGDGALFARAGAAYEPSPVPPQRRDTNYLDANRWIGGASVGWRWLGVGTWRLAVPLVFDVGGQVQYLPPRVAWKNDDIDPNNPGYPKVGCRGWLYAVGASFTVPFDYE